MVVQNSAGWNIDFDKQNSFWKYWISLPSKQLDRVARAEDEYFIRISPQPAQHFTRYNTQALELEINKLLNPALVLL